MFAVVGNLADPSNPSPAALAGPDFFGFDVAGVCLGFHHFDDPELTARRLVERLRPGGVLLILDFFPHAPASGGGHGHGHGHEDGQENQHHGPAHGHDHSHDHGGHGHGQGHGHGGRHGHTEPENATHTVRHHGFSEERVRAIFEQAGAGTGFEMQAIGTGFVFRGGERNVFIARGVKA